MFIPIGATTKYNKLMHRGGGRMMPVAGDNDPSYGGSSSLRNHGMLFSASDTILRHALMCCYVLMLFAVESQRAFPGAALMHDENCEVMSVTSSDASVMSHFRSKQPNMKLARQAEQNNPRLAPTGNALMNNFVAPGSPALSRRTPDQHRRR
jgi:hypothetical protein